MKMNQNLLDIFGNRNDIDIFKRSNKEKLKLNKIEKKPCRKTNLYSLEKEQWKYIADWTKVIENLYDLTIVILFKSIWKEVGQFNWKNKLGNLVKPLRQIRFTQSR